MSPRPRRRIEQKARGGFRVNLGEDERALIAALPAQVEELLANMDPSESPANESTARLFPPAYVRDEQAEQSFVASVRGELIEHHRNALAVLVETANATEINEAQLENWLTALNDIRIVLGSSLGVTEDQKELDTDDPFYGEWICYHYLSFLLGEVVDALSGALPPPWASDEDPLPDDPWGEPPGGLRWDGTSRPSAEE